MTSSMTSESWSRTRLKSICSVPTLIHENGKFSTAGSGTAEPKPVMLRAALSTSPNEASGSSRPMAVVRTLGSLRPRIPFNRNPAKGRSGISQR